MAILTLEVLSLIVDDELFGLFNLNRIDAEYRATVALSVSGIPDTERTLPATILVNPFVFTGAYLMNNEAIRIRSKVPSGLTLAHSNKRLLICINLTSVQERHVRTGSAVPDDDLVGLAFNGAEGPLAGISCEILIGRRVVRLGLVHVNPVAATDVHVEPLSLSEALGDSTLSGEIDLRGTLFNGVYIFLEVNKTLVSCHDVSIRLEGCGDRRSSAHSERSILSSDNFLLEDEIQGHVYNLILLKLPLIDLIIGVLRCNFLDSVCPIRSACIVPAAGSIFNIARTDSIEVALLKEHLSLPAITIVTCCCSKSTGGQVGYIIGQRRIGESCSAILHLEAVLYIVTASYLLEFKGTTVCSTCCKVTILSNIVLLSINLGEDAVVLATLNGLKSAIVICHFAKICQAEVVSERPVFTSVFASRLLNTNSKSGIILRNFHFDAVPIQTVLEEGCTLVHIVRVFTDDGYFTLARSLANLTVDIDNRSFDIASIEDRSIVEGFAVLHLISMSVAVTVAVICLNAQNVLTSLGESDFLR